MTKPRWLRDPGLAPDALAVWKTHAPRAFSDGYLKAETAHLFMAACRYVAIANAAAAAIEAEGVLIGTKSGAQKSNPAFAVMRIAQRDAAVLLRGFGFHD